MKTVIFDNKKTNTICIEDLVNSISEYNTVHMYMMEPLKHIIGVVLIYSLTKNQLVIQTQIDGRITSTRNVIEIPANKDLVIDKLKQLGIEYLCTFVIDPIVAID